MPSSTSAAGWGRATCPWRVRHGAQAHGPRTRRGDRRCLGSRARRGRASPRSGCASAMVISTVGVPRRGHPAAVRIALGRWLRRSSAAGGGTGRSERRLTARSIAGADVAAFAGMRRRRPPDRRPPLDRRLPAPRRRRSPDGCCAGRSPMAEAINAPVHEPNSSDRVVRAARQRRGPRGGRRVDRRACSTCCASASACSVPKAPANRGVRVVQRPRRRRCCAVASSSRLRRRPGDPHRRGSRRARVADRRAAGVRRGRRGAVRVLHPGLIMAAARPARRRA